MHDGEGWEGMDGGMSDGGRGGRGKPKFDNSIER